MDKPDDLGLAVIARAWADNAFREEFCADPREALARHFGITLPNGIELRVHQDDPRTLHFVIPEKPSELEEADLELETLAAGGGLRSLGHDAAPLTGSATSNWVSCCKPA